LIIQNCAVNAVSALNVNTPTPPTPAPQQTPAVAPSVEAPVPTTIQATIAPVKSAAALRADELIQKKIQSRGGWDKIKAINTIRMTGKMIMMQGMEAPMTMEMARPGKIRTEFILQGMTAVQTYDGKDGWILNPFLGKTEAEPITGQQLEDLKTQANFEGMLMDYEAKGYQVEFADNVDLEGTPTYKLKITKKNGDLSYLWLDAQSYLEIQSSAKTNVNGQEVEAITMFGDFKESGGVLFAHFMQTKMVDLPAPGMTLTIEKIEVNPSLAPARFGKP
jgi:outer membrane lipoprotein-sorting protein